MNVISEYNSECTGKVVREIHKRPDRIVKIAIWPADLSLLPSFHKIHAYEIADFFKSAHIHTEDFYTMDINIKSKNYCTRLLGLSEIKRIGTSIQNKMFNKEMDKLLR